MDKDLKQLLGLILRTLEVLISQAERTRNKGLPPNIKIMDSQLNYARSCLDEAKELEEKLLGE